MKNVEPPVGGLWAVEPEVAHDVVALAVPQDVVTNLHGVSVAIRMQHMSVL